MFHKMVIDLISSRKETDILKKLKRKKNLHYLLSVDFLSFHWLVLIDNGVDVLKKKN